MLDSADEQALFRFSGLGCRSKFTARQKGVPKLDTEAAFRFFTGVAILAVSHEDRSYFGFEKRNVFGAKLVFTYSRRCRNEEARQCKKFVSHGVNYSRQVHSIRPQFEVLVLGDEFGVLLGVGEENKSKLLKSIYEPGSVCKTRSSFLPTSGLPRLPICWVLD